MNNQINNSILNSTTGDCRDMRQPPYNLDQIELSNFTKLRS